MTATNTFGATGLLARNSGGSSVLYAFDEAGNTVERLTTSGTVLNSVYTDAFGATTGAASGDPYSGFGAKWGYYTDSETGLTLCGHRFYDSTVGRWVGRDPAGYGGGVNLYRGFANSPLGSFDPSGLAPWQQWVAIGVGAAIGFVGGGPLGAISGGMAGNNLYQAVVGAGTVQGAYDGGQASGWRLAGAYGNLAMAAGDVLAPAVGGVGGEDSPGAPSSSGKYTGDLTPEEIEQIQQATNAAGRPIHVVGSAARGTRRNVGSSLPIGKGPGTQSDIDYLIPHSSSQYWNGNTCHLPGMDTSHGPFGGVPNPFMGPSIPFEPEL